MLVVTRQLINELVTDEPRNSEGDFRYPQERDNSNFWGGLRREEYGILYLISEAQGSWRVCLQSPLRQAGPAGNSFYTGGHTYTPPDICWEVPIAMDANLGESHRLESLCKASEGTSQRHHSWALPTRPGVWSLHPRGLSSPICSQVGHWQRDSPAILPGQVEKVAG